MSRRSNESGGNRRHSERDKKPSKVVDRRSVGKAE